MGILRRAVELGRIDIITEVSVLLAHNCAPRKGHLKAAYQMFEFLSDHGSFKVVFDSSYITVNETAFIPVNWEEIYGDIEEEIPTNLPQARGNPVQVSMFTDAAHAGDLITRRSQTGIIVMLNSAPII